MGRPKLRRCRRDANGKFTASSWLFHVAFMIAAILRVMGRWFLLIDLMPKYTIAPHDTIDLACREEFIFMLRDKCILSADMLSFVLLASTCTVCAPPLFFFTCGRWHFCGFLSLFALSLQMRAF